MRLTKNLAEVAKHELVALVRTNPGIATSELVGTPKFHGERTLRSVQIIRLLRAAGLEPRLEGQGARTWYSWRV